MGTKVRRAPMRTRCHFRGPRRQVSRTGPEEEAEAALPPSTHEFGRTTDPCAMYMRENGSVEL